MFGTAFVIYVPCITEKSDVCRKEKEMANKSIFKSIVGRLLPKTDTLNREFAPAYKYTPKHMLAQYAATGCTNHTFYATASEQVETILEQAGKVDPDFVAKTAIYARERGFMKDMPALLTAVLSVRAPELLRRVFERVIDNGKMVRNYVQITRSGVTGRKSLGSLPKRLVRNWLDSRSDKALFRASVGNDPSVADIIKMVHPRPSTASREALYGYLIGKEYNTEVLPEIVKQYEAFKAGITENVPDVPFQMLTSFEIGKKEWIEIARNAPWQMTRMNLNTFARHGVFEDREIVRLIAQRLRNPEAIGKARVFPYQLMIAFLNANESIPVEVRDALQDAMEIATANVPVIKGKVYVCPDVSGSMHSPVTGYRRGSTTKVRCVDVAALVAASILRRNPDAEVLPFEHRVVKARINSRDSIMTNAERLAKIGGGGTNCSAPVSRLNRRGAEGDLVIFVSDNESWVDARFGRRGTGLMRQWNMFKQRNPEARLVCIDILPYGDSQAAEREDILNIGGFSDRVFEVVEAFAAGRLSAEHWIGEIDKIEL